MTAISPHGSESARAPLVFRDGDPAAPGRAVAAVGNFDGVHLGHRRLIDVARREAARGGRPVAVLTFEPHPRDHFRPDEPGFRLTSPAAKLKILGRLGVDVIFVRRFDAALAEMGAAEFVSAVLVRALDVSAAVVGTNFRFGRAREGSPERLRELARAQGIEAYIEPPVEQDGAPVSSSRIRDALAAGDIGTANRLLGHRWFVDGPVVHGEKRGRTLGYPTANLRLDPGCRLAHGIYAVRVATPDGAVRGGVASYGRRPTFDDGAPLLETFLFGFAGDLYGQPIEVEFLAWLRGEERFASAADLVDAMNRDADGARRVLANPAASPSLIG